MHLNLTQVVDFEDPFLLAVYASTRADELKLLPWSDEQKRDFVKMQLLAQHQHYLSHYPAAAYQIIKLADEPVGRLYVDRNNERIRIIDIAILPKHRNKGIGTQLIAEILREGEQTNKPIEIYIESFNQSSKLFSRKGFQPIAEEGFYILWQWKPSATTSSEKAASAA